MDKDTNTLLLEIKAATDWSEPKISAESGVPQPTINRISNGQTDCKLSTHRLIQKLHERVCRKNSRRKEVARA